uniref:Uncharacterized protein n=1 Tax=Panagrolaimus sp. ES5 TaxID=591445 RepID=A0AC34G0I2_9BILA
MASKYPKIESKAPKITWYYEKSDNEKRHLREFNEERQTWGFTCTCNSKERNEKIHPRYAIIEVIKQYGLGKIPRKLLLTDVCDIRLHVDGCVLYPLQRKFEILGTFKSRIDDTLNRTPACEITVTKSRFFGSVPAASTPNKMFNESNPKHESIAESGFLAIEAQIHLDNIDKELGKIFERDYNQNNISLTMKAEGGPMSFCRLLRKADAELQHKLLGSLFKMMQQNPQLLFPLFEIHRTVYFTLIQMSKIEFTQWLSTVNVDGFDQIFNETESVFTLMAVVLAACAAHQLDFDDVPESSWVKFLTSSKNNEANCEFVWKQTFKDPELGILHSYMQSNSFFVKGCVAGSYFCSLRDAID